MVSVLTKQQINRTFMLRMGLQGKSAFPGTGDADEQPQIVLPDLPGKLGPSDGRKPKATTAAEQSYAALYSEGTTLYQRNEFARAIEAFSKANDLTVDRPNPNILIDRADCYIQIGKPELALEDVNKVLIDNKDNPRAILTKAEAYFSMGEFEFALVFFQRGLAKRKDMGGFRDGVTKAKHAILDSISGESIFQPNPNYALSRPRKQLVETRAMPKPESEEMEEEIKPASDPAKLLPEKVATLTTRGEKEKFLGELSLDYQFLKELECELNDASLNVAKDGEKEDEEIKKIVTGALDYLQQRGAFWNQQGKEKVAVEPSANETGKAGSPAQSTKKSPKARRDVKVAKSQQPHYEMSKLQQYESKYQQPEQ